MISIVKAVLDYKPPNPALNFPDDLGLLPVAVLGWSVLHFILFYCVFTYIADLFFPKSKTTAVKSLKGKVLTNDQQRHKLYIACWKFTHFLILAIVGVCIVAKEDWTFSIPKYFENYPNQPMSYLMKIYFNMQIGGYIYACLLIPFEPKQNKRDILALVVHHAVTITLIWLAYTQSFQRSGTIVAVLHDISDPIMEFAKIILYAGYNKLADAIFALFALSFIVTRNFIFPYTLVEMEKYCRWPDNSYIPTNNILIFMQGLFLTLELLHIYWGYLIVQMAFKAYADNGVSDDIRNVDGKKKKVQ
ncbi:TLC domain-containing protein [Globomyces pollinis-pini]|nr:TLC domain-containing protein [Globomyces pollinis-pini]